MSQKFAKLTDEMITRARLTIGRETPARNQWHDAATKDAIKHFTWGYGDLNPLFLDEEYARNTAWKTILAPPLFPLSTYMGPLYPTEVTASRGEGLPGIMSLHSGAWFKFYEPIRLNDRVETIKKIAGIVDSDARVEGDLIEPSADVARAFQVAAKRWGAYTGRMVDQVIQYKTYVSGKLVTEWLEHYVRVERGAIAVEKGKYRDLGLPRYTTEELERIAEAYENEFLRGHEVLYWEDVNVGQELPTVVKGPLTITGIIAFFMGFGGHFTMTDRIMHLFLHRFPGANFPHPETNVPDVPERAHWDTWMAGTLGWPRAYDMGQMAECAFAHLVTNWMGDDAFLRNLTWWRLRPWFLHEAMWVHGRVTGKEIVAKEPLVHLDLWCETQVDKKIVRICEGSAIVALKSRSV